MYFSKLPKINYRLTDNPYKEVARSVLAVDITAGSRIVRGVVNDVKIIDTYTVNDFETPEIVAENLWGVAEWHWVLLVLNEIFHPSDWVLNSRDFEEMILQKYGSQENAERVAYFRDPITEEVVLPNFGLEGFRFRATMDYTSEIGFPFVRWYDLNGVEIEEPESVDTVAGLDAVTYYEHESELNESKRTIRVVSKAIADAIVGQYRAQMGSV